MVDWSTNSSWLSSQALATAQPDKYGFDPNAGLSNIGGVQHTGLYGVSQPASTPSKSSAPSTPAEPPPPKVVERRDWSDYQTDEMNMAHQMNEYTSEDSPLMIGAKTQAMRDQVGRGLLNTQGTISAIQNNQWNLAQPLASEDVTRATNVALTQMGDDLQRDMLDANISSNERMTYAKIWGDMVNIQLASMGAVMSSGDVKWTQSMQDNFEDSIGAGASVVGSMFNIQLS